MTLKEKIELELVKVAVKMARENNVLAETIRDLDKETLTYLIKNGVCTPGEVATAFLG